MKKGKYVIVLFILLPLITFLIIIQLRHTITPTKEEIIEDIVKADAYKAKVEYIIKNPKGEYNEETTIYYKKGMGYRVEFEEDRVKIYRDGYISVKDNNYEYEIEEGMDTLYILGFVGNLLSNELIDINENTEEWGDIEYLEVLLTLPSKNNHLSKVIIYIDKKDKVPMVTKIYDSNGDEKVIIIYREFEYVEKLKGDLFQ